MKKVRTQTQYCLSECYLWAPTSAIANFGERGVRGRTAKSSDKGFCTLFPCIGEWGPCGGNPRLRMWPPPLSYGGSWCEIRKIKAANSDFFDLRGSFYIRAF